MKTAGIICEYNPFHTGHKHQIEMLKKEFDAVVCVMSGSFVQRGEVAIFDKWTRTKAALSNGADLVIELPVKNVLSSAEGFANGGVMLLDALGIIDSISFGSECGDIELLKKYAETILSEPSEVSEKIKALTKDGLSFAKARSMAYSDILDEEILASPNNILAIEYIKALLQIKSTITPMTHKRLGAGYHDKSEADGFASATLIREKIRKGENADKFMPYNFSSAVQYDTNKLTDIFKYKLIKEGCDAFSGIADIEPGLDNRFLKAINEKSITDIVDFVKTKRYAYTRLSRIAMRVILGLRDTDYKPEYVRILGFSETGKTLLAKMKTTCTLPIVNKVADFGSNAILPDISATDISALCADTSVPFGRDYTTSPIII